MGADTPPRRDGDAPSQGSKLKLDRKLARIDKHQYTDSRPETWHNNIRTYFIGEHVDMKGILDIIEAQGHDKISIPKFAQLLDGAMVALEPAQVSQEMWSWLNLSLESSVSAQRVFHNIEELNGAEVYRALIAPLGKTAPSITRLNILRDKVQNPAKAKGFSNIMEMVSFWESDLIDFRKAGGEEPDDINKRHQLGKILAGFASMDDLEKANEQLTSDDLIKWFRAKATFQSEHAKSKDGGVHAAETSPIVDVPAPPEIPEGGWEVSEEDMLRMNDQEFLAFVRNGGRAGGKGKGKNCKKGGFRTGGWYGGKTGPAGRQDPPPKGAEDLRCINCGGHGHRIGACTKELVPVAKRPCLNCGLPGHFFRDCRNAKKAFAVDGGGETAAAPEAAPATSWNPATSSWNLCVINETQAPKLLNRVRGRPFDRSTSNDSTTTTTTHTPGAHIHTRCPTTTIAIATAKTTSTTTTSMSSKKYESGTTLGDFVPEGFELQRKQKQKDRKQQRKLDRHIGTFGPSVDLLHADDGILELAKQELYWRTQTHTKQTQLVQRSEPPAAKEAEEKAETVSAKALDIQCIIFHMILLIQICSLRTAAICRRVVHVMVSPLNPFMRAVAFCRRSPIPPISSPLFPLHQFLLPHVPHHTIPMHGAWTKALGATTTATDSLRAT